MHKGVSHPPAQPVGGSVREAGPGGAAAGGVGTGAERGSGAGLVQAEQILPSAVSYILLQRVCEPHFETETWKKKTTQKPLDTHTTKTK